MAGIYSTSTHILVVSPPIKCTQHVRPQVLSLRAFRVSADVAVAMADLLLKRSAVVEYQPLAKEEEEDYAAYVLRNVKEYERIISEAKERVMKKYVRNLPSYSKCFELFAQGIDLIVFPEYGLTGTGIGDHLGKEKLVELAKQLVGKLRIFGTPLFEIAHIRICRILSDCSEVSVLNTEFTSWSVCRRWRTTSSTRGCSTPPSPTIGAATFWQSAYERKMLMNAKEQTQGSS